MMVKATVKLILMTAWSIFYLSAVRRGNGFFSAKRVGPARGAVPYRVDSRGKIYTGEAAPGYLLIRSFPGLWASFRLSSFYQSALSVLDSHGRGSSELEAELALMLSHCFLLAGLYPVFLFHGSWLLILISLLIIHRLLLPFHRYKDQLHRWQSELVEQLPTALMQVSLAIKSGLLPEEAWAQVARSSEGLFYRTMEEVVIKQRGGQSAVKAFREFGARYRLTVLRDIGSGIAQGLENGGEEVTGYLERIRLDIYRRLKRSYRIAAEKAGQRMVFPSLLLFIGIMILVLLPVLGRAFI